MSVKLSNDQLHKAAVGGLLGLAVGDAFGVPVEFLSRKRVRQIRLENMIGCDTAERVSSYWGGRIPAGAWSDDTSMTLATMVSIIKRDGRISFEDIMSRFELWWQHGLYTSIGRPFGIGGCVEEALLRYERNVDALECGGKGIRDNGNGSLMRIFPFSTYCIAKGYNDERTSYLIGLASGITHAHEISKMGCFVYTEFLKRCIETGNPQTAFESVCARKDFKDYYGRWFSPETIRAYAGIQKINPGEIGETGYVVDSLKTAIYSLTHTDKYEDAVKMAINFGYDTDTNGAITGSIAGAMYGTDEIPDRWLTQLKKRGQLERIADEFVACVLKCD